MPCYDERTSPDYTRKEAFKEYRHNSPVAEMLCYLCKVIDASGEIHLLPTTIQEWWEEHKERDAKKDTQLSR